jgi:hypothetical protein
MKITSQNRASKKISTSKYTKSSATHTQGWPQIVTASRFGLTQTVSLFAIAIIVGVAGVHLLSPSHAAVAVTNPSGMTWASGCWQNSAGGDADFQNYRGTKCDYLHFYTYRGGWGDLDNPSVLYDSNYTSQPGQLEISTTTFPENAVDYPGCAAGKYNSHYTTLGNNLKNADGGRYAAAVIRPNWEFNGDYFTWGANNYSSTAPVSATDYANCFDQFSKSVKAADPQARLDWTMNGATTPANNFNGAGAYAAYPGNAYVDIIGVDEYDMYPGTPNANSWNAKYNNGQQGLGTIIAFARSHGKLFSVGEWGVRNIGDGNDAGDDTYYIQQMFNTFNANKDILAYESYFADVVNGDSVNSGFNFNPNSGALYKQLWGPNGPARGSSALGTSVGGGTYTPPSPQISQTNNLLTGKTFTPTNLSDSTTETGPITNINDKDETQRWISTPSDNAYLTTDLGASYTLSKVSILWAADTTKDYEIQMSPDNSTWTTVYTGATNGQSTPAQLTDTVPFTHTASGRYLRIHFIDRWSSTYGNSIWEIGAYGTADSGGTTTPPVVTSGQIVQTGNLATGKTFTSSVGDSTDVPNSPPGHVNDGNEGTRWVSLPADGVTLSTDLGASYTLSKVSVLWAGDTTKDYDIQTSSDGTTWTTAASAATNGISPDLTNNTFTATGRYVRIVAKDRWNNTYGNSIYEIGIYGSAVQSGPLPVLGDTNGDHVINGQDIATIVHYWGQHVTVGTNGDLNGNGVVDTADISILVHYWPKS